jgi:hypothetical protein
VADQEIDELEAGPARLPVRAITIGAVVLVLVVAGFGLWGVIDAKDKTPRPQEPARLQIGAEYRFGTVKDVRQFTVALPLQNVGQAAVTVATFGGQASGLRLVAAGVLPVADVIDVGDPAFDIPTNRTFDLPVGEQRLIALRYEVEDCLQATRKDVPVPVTIEISNQTLTVDLAVPDVEGHPWIAYFVQNVCG